MYREKIRQLASSAMAKYGTEVSLSSSVRCVALDDETCRLSFFPSPLIQLLIDGLSGVPGHSPDKSDADFFMEHTQVRVFKPDSFTSSQIASCSARTVPLGLEGLLLSCILVQY